MSVYIKGMEMPKRGGGQMIAFIVGLFLGVDLGVLLSALALAAKRLEEIDERTNMVKQSEEHRPGN